MQNSLCEEKKASSKAFRRRMVLVLRMLQSLIIPSQEHVCSLLMLLFAGSSAQSRQIHDCRGAGSHSASRFRDTNTCTHTTHPLSLSISVTHTHKRRHTIESLLKEETLMTSLDREQATGQKYISWPLGYNSAVCHVTVCPKLRPDSWIASAIIRCLSRPSILMPPDRDAP